MNRLVRFLCFLSLLLPATALAEGAGEWVTHLLHLPIPKSMTLCGEPVPLGREDVAERLDLELVVVLGNPVSTTLWFKRIPRYFPAIEREIRERQLPEDLKYVALVESNLRASAISPAGAAGPWQFMRGTGAEYGLDRSWWQDERRDWSESTRAALEHLNDLRTVLGSWPLALAAYNAGKARVQSALEAQGQKDFYGLRLPRETERYVFRVLAAKLVVEDPGAYGIGMDGARLYSPEKSVEVPVEVGRRPLPVAAVAAAAGTSFRGLLELNPDLRGRELPRGTHWLLIPRRAAEGFGAALARWKAENPAPRSVYYRVRKGDTLSAIARRHDVRLSDLLSWNHLSAKSVIRPGQELVVQSVD